MENVVLKALAFVFIIALGYGLKKAGVFKREDYKTMAKVVLNITLRLFYAAVCAEHFRTVGGGRGLYV